MSFVSAFVSFVVNLITYLTTMDTKVYHKGHEGIQLLHYDIKK